MKTGLPGTPGEAIRIHVKAFLRSDAFRYRRGRLSLKQPPPTQLIQHDPVGSTRPGMRRLSMASTAGLKALAGPSPRKASQEPRERYSRSDLFNLTGGRTMKRLIMTAVMRVKPARGGSNAGGCEPPTSSARRSGAIARRSAILLSGTAAIALSIAQPAGAIVINDQVAASRTISIQATSSPTS
jgi:hypothetical protein